MSKQFDNYFGGCPTCGGTDGYLNAGKGHWFVCDEHKSIWFVGVNLFSSWQDETEDEQREAWKRVETYAQVDAGPARDPMAKVIDEGDGALSIVGSNYGQCDDEALPF